MLRFANILNPFRRAEPVKSADDRVPKTRAFQVPRDRTTARHWGPSGHQPVARGLSVLRARARDLAHNNANANACIVALTDNTVGTGIRPAIQGDKKFERWYLDHVSTPAVDHDGRYPLDTLLYIAIRTMYEAGECFGIIRRKLIDGVLLPTLQIVDPDQVNEGASAKRKGNKVNSGFELTVEGQIYGVHFWADIERTKSIFVRWENVVHFMDPKYAGQLRGIPAGIQALVASDNVDQLLIRSLQRAKIQSSMMLFLSAEHNAALDQMPEIGEPAEDDTEYVLPREIESGSVSILPPGWKVQTAQSPDATGSEAFVKIGHRIIATAYCVQYSQVSGDLEKVNFSSMKGGRIEFRRRIACAQKHGVEPGLWKLMGHAKACYGISTGRKIRITSMAWTYPGQESIDPLKDAQADTMNVAAGIDTVFDVVRRDGREPGEFIDELVREVELFRSKGLIHPMDRGIPVIPPDPDGDDDDQETDDSETDDDDDA